MRGGRVGGGKARSQTLLHQLQLTFGGGETPPQSLTVVPCPLGLLGPGQPRSPWELSLAACLPCLGLGGCLPQGTHLLGTQ